MQSLMATLRDVFVFLPSHSCKLDKSFTGSNSVAKTISIMSKHLWWQIEEGLGDVTDFEMTDKNGVTIVTYKSNGESKTIAFTDTSKKLLIQSFVFASKLLIHQK